MWNNIWTWAKRSFVSSINLSKTSIAGARKITSASQTGIRWIIANTKGVFVYILVAIGLIRKGFSTISNGFRSVRKAVKGYYIPDLRLNPITWNLLFRPVVSALAGIVVATAVKFLTFVLHFIGYLPVDPVDFRIFFSITALVLIQVIRPEENLEKVPETDYGALVTFLGISTPVIRTSGDYYWLGTRLWFDRSRKPFMGVNDTAGNRALNEGFIPLGDITFQVWDSAHASSKEAQSSLTRPAKNRSPVTGSLTLIGDFHRPRLWLKAIDPALDIGDRARQEYQEIIETLVDTDVAALQARMQPYLFGKSLITTFVTGNVEGYKIGSMIRDSVGLVMCEVVEEGETVDQAKQRFLTKVMAEADPKILKFFKKEKRTVPVTELKVSDPLTEATEDRGLNLRRVTFGDVILADKVSAAAEQASAEADERMAQIASAKTIKESRKILKPTPTELKNLEVYQLTTVLAAAADDKNGNIRVVMVPGGDRLANSIIAAGQQIGGNKP